jgi:hypothetical protein
MNDTVPVPRRLILRLACALAGAVLFLAISTAHGSVVPGFDPWHQSVSALALAPGGWIQVVNFIVLGASVLVTVPAWRRVLRGGRGATWYPALTVALGLSLAVAGCIPQDPAPAYDPAGRLPDVPTMTGLLHLAVAGIAALSSVALMLIVAARLAGDPHWPGWAARTRLVALLTVACIVIYGVWSTQASGLAGTYERLAVVLPALWSAAFLRRLWIGRPFMHATSSIDQPRPRPRQ